MLLPTATLYGSFSLSNAQSPPNYSLSSRIHVKQGPSDICTPSTNYTNVYSYSSYICVPGIPIFLVFRKCLCCTNFANKIPKCSSVIHINILQLSLRTFFEVPLAGNNSNHKCITKNPPQSL